MINIVEQIQSENAGRTDRLAVAEGDRRITYAELFAAIEQLADRLRSAGIHAGERIAFHCPDGIDYIIGSLALLRVGAAVVPLADSLTSEEIAETVERIDVAGVMTHASVGDRDRGEANGLCRGTYPPAEPGAARDPETPPSSHLAAPGFAGGYVPREGPPNSATTLDRQFTFSPRAVADPSLNTHCDKLGAAFIRFSSGTTGQSKGVLLSHQTILDRTDAADAGLRVTPADTICWTLGMSHHFVVSILLFLRRGATIVVANKQFPFSIIQSIAAWPITLIYGSPVHYFLLARSGSTKPDALPKLRLAVSTSMRLPPDIAAAFENKFSHAIAEAYGIIEVGLPFIHDTTDGTLGPPLPAYELRIDLPDADGIGTVLLRGKGMFDAYVSPWRTREELALNGWFNTGDLGRVDVAGRLTLLGRSKTVLVCAGMKVFPEEVEAVLNACDGVAESLVYGQPHAQYGQMPMADVVAKTLPADGEAWIAVLRSICVAALSSYKVPVKIRIVPSLPKTTSGKIARTRSQAMHANY